MNQTPIVKPPVIPALARVEWADTCVHAPGWRHIAELEDSSPLWDTSPAVAVGFIIRQTDEAVTLAADLIDWDDPENASINRVTVIPRGMIRRMDTML